MGDFKSCLLEILEKRLFEESSFSDCYGKKTQNKNQKSYLRRMNVDDSQNICAS